MVIVDTSVWIDFFNNAASLEIEKLSNLGKKNMDIFTCGIIITEILSGVKNKKEKDLLKENFLQLRPVEPVYPETYIKAASIFSEGRKKGITIRKTVDCIIAQLAIENDLYILHKDIDYERISSFTKLKVY